MERPLVKQVVPDDHGISLTQTDSAAYIETKTIADSITLTARAMKRARKELAQTTFPPSTGGRLHSATKS